VAAGLGGAAAMALGTVLSRRWQPPVSALTFTAWQLTAGGLLLAPAALLFEPRLGVPSAANLLGFGYLTLIGAALTYALWFRGIARLEPSVVSSLGFLSPLTAVLLGWAVLGQTLTLAQAAGMGIVVFSVWLSQRAAAAPTMPRAGTAT
ncbi:MAG: EamA family transporter, partial [Burkholderiaceae bacterium]